MTLTYFGFEDVGIFRVVLVFVLWALIIWFLVWTIIQLRKSHKFESFGSFKGLFSKKRKK